MEPRAWFVSPQTDAPCGSGVHRQRPPSVNRSKPCALTLVFDQAYSATAARAGEQLHAAHPVERSRYLRANVADLSLAPSRDSCLRGCLCDCFSPGRRRLALLRRGLRVPRDGRSAGRLLRGFLPPLLQGRRGRGLGPGRRSLARWRRRVRCRSGARLGRAPRGTLTRYCLEWRRQRRFETLAHETACELLPVALLQNRFSLTVAPGHLVVIRIHIALAHAPRGCMTGATPSPARGRTISSSRYCRPEAAPGARSDPDSWTAAPAPRVDVRTSRPT